jgi:curved DNA-binding protein CbpA
VTHYEVLGVAPTASAAEIKRAYRDQARRHHPDLGGGDDTMERLNRAWATLGDPARRRAYDTVLGIGGVNAPPRPPQPQPIVVDEEGEADWGPEPEPGPPEKRDLLLLLPVTLLGCAACCVGVGALLYASVFLGLAVFFGAAALFTFALMPILTLRRQARSNYRR